MQNSNIEKCIKMAGSGDNFIFEIFLDGCFLKTAAKIYYFRNSRFHMFYISYSDVMLKENEFLLKFF